ncbi:MAG: carboxymuconolactone decarboxylase family protein [Planctomycetota bacterium]
MSNINALTIDSAPAASQPLLEAVKAKMGKVPNLLGTLAHAPAGLQSYLGLSEALGGGLFSGGEREIIALAIGEANQCDYCLAAHTMIGGMNGLDSETMQKARAGGLGDAKLEALAALAREITATRGRPSATSLDTFRSAGWTDGHVIELIAHVALNTLTNYVNEALGTEIDFPRADALAA